MHGQQNIKIVSDVWASSHLTSSRVHCTLYSNSKKLSTTCLNWPTIA